MSTVSGSPRALRARLARAALVLAAVTSIVVGYWAEPAHAIGAFSINDVSADENDGGATTTFTFTVTLSTPSVGTTTVNYVVDDGGGTYPATAPGDYVDESGTVSLSTGETQDTIDIVVNNDAFAEPNESFRVVLSSPGPVGTTISDGTGVGTIVNDDGTIPQLSVADATVAEGNTGTTNATFDVSLSPASGQTVTVNYATVNGAGNTGATQPADYTTSTGTLTFAAGVTTQPIVVPVVGDTRDEADETYVVVLSNSNNAALNDATATGTITDDDDEPAISVADVSRLEGDTGTSALTFTISMTNPSGSTLDVAYSTQDDTAVSTGTADYAAASSTVRFTPGQVSRTVDVTINGDNVLEPNETFKLNLTGVSQVDGPAGHDATISDAQAIGTITNDDTPVFAVNDAPVANEGASAQFTVSLSRPAASSVSVDFAALEGTASEPEDFAATSGTLTFSPGAPLSQSVPVPLANDTLDENDETFTLVLTNQSAGTTIADASGTGTIVDTDDPPTVSVSAPPAVTEGNVTVDVPVTLSTASAKPVTVKLSTKAADSTAAAGTDYTTVTDQVVTIPAGQLTANGQVQVHDDNVPENAETIRVALSAPTNATIGTGTADITIAANNDGGAPDLTIDDITANEGDTIDGTENFGFTLTLSDEATGNVTVQVFTQDVTATAGSDYTGITTPVTVTFVAGELTKPVNVTVSGDDLAEPNETFRVRLANATGAVIADNTGIGTITNDDGTAPSIAIGDAVADPEGAGGTSTLNFTVTVTGTSTQSIVVGYQTADGTAEAGKDYQAKSGTLTIPAFSSTGTISVTILGDTLFENADETFTVVLSDARNATISDGTATGTISDDENQPVITFESPPPSGVEGDVGSTSELDFVVKLSNPSVQEVTVDFATADFTAVDGFDYSATDGTLVFEPGDTQHTITVTIVGDGTDEADEEFDVDLSLPSNATLGDFGSTGTIEDDDDPPVATINDAQLAEADAGTTDMTFTVSLSEASGLTVTVDFATVDGTAVDPDDYTDTLDTVTFDPGETTKTITIDVVDDDLDEPNETFDVELSDPTNATLGASSTGTGTILDDDVVPTLAINDVTVTEGNSGTTEMTFTVTISDDYPVDVTADWATSEGTATDPEDFTTSSGTVTFASGTTTSQTITVPIVGDTLDEPAQTLTVTMSSPENATLADATGTGTISDDDATPTVSIADPSAAFEGANGTTTQRTFAVTLGAPSERTLEVDWATANGTATAVSDYDAGSGTVTFAPGDTSESVSVTAKGDFVVESNETFVVNLSSPDPSDMPIGDAQGVATIVNDDKSTTMSIALAPSSVKYGQFVAISGRLTEAGTNTGLGNRQVQLLRRPTGTTTWTIIATATSESDGTVSLGNAPSRNSQYAWRFLGAGNHAPDSSPVASAGVKPLVSAAFNDPTLSLGQTAHLRGVVTPSHAGQRVYLQRFFNGAWHTVTSQLLNSTSRYDFAIRPSTRGTFTYRVFKRPDGDHLGNGSSSRKLIIS